MVIKVTISKQGNYYLHKTLWLIWHRNPNVKFEAAGINWYKLGRSDTSRYEKITRQLWKGVHNKNSQDNQNSKHSITYYFNKSLKLTIAFGLSSDHLEVSPLRDIREHTRGVGGTNFTLDPSGVTESVDFEVYPKNQVTLTLTHLGCQQPYGYQRGLEGRIQTNSPG